MTSATVTEKLLSNIYLAVIARLSLAVAPVVFTFVTYLTVQMYNGFTATQALQQQQIMEIQKELQDHQFRLDTGKQARLDLQSNTEKQFATIANRLDVISDKMASINDSVIRVQTIIETRLPSKDTSLRMPLFGPTAQ